MSPRRWKRPLPWYNGREIHGPSWHEVGRRYEPVLGVGRSRGVRPSRPVPRGRGPGLLLSLNYEHRIAEALALRIGFGFALLGYTLPIALNVLCFSAPHHLELGVGVAPGSSPCRSPATLPRRWSSSWPTWATVSVRRGRFPLPHRVHAPFPPADRPDPSLGGHRPGVRLRALTETGSLRPEEAQRQGAPSEKPHLRRGEESPNVGSGPCPGGEPPHPGARVQVGGRGRSWRREKAVSPILRTFRRCSPCPFARGP